MFGFMPKEDKKELIIFLGCFVSLIPLGALLESHLMMGVAMSSFDPDDFIAFHPWMEFSTLLALLCTITSLLIFWRLFRTQLSWFWGGLAILLQWIPLVFFWVAFTRTIPSFF